MEIIVSRHAKKRIKQRVSKNWQQIANNAFEFGVNHNALKGRIKKHIDHLVFKERAVGIYKIFNENVYLFGSNNILITVLHLPKKHVNLARKLTKKNQLNLI